MREKWNARGLSPSMTNATQAARASAPEAVPLDTAQNDAKPRTAPHYAFLDGMRGLGALVVVLFHLLQPFGGEHELPDTWTSPPLLRQIALSLFIPARYAVVVFIILSGYCLMLPVVSSPDLRLRGGLWSYVVRRSRRILPTYLAALLLSVAFYRLVWKAPVNPLSVGAHALLIHHLFPSFTYDLNPVMWTVGIEWHIYAFFPLLLLPAWRRWGWMGAVFVAFAVSLAPIFVLPAGFDLTWTAPWFLGLFALGMAAASADPHRLPWGLISLGATALGVIAGEIGGVGKAIVDDILVGVGMASLILACVRWSEAARTQANAARPLILKLLESRPIVWIGTISYSLYLTHILVKWGLLERVRAMKPSIPLGLGALLGGGVVISMVAGYLLHRLVERPFMTPARRSRSPRRSDAASSSRAPPRS